MYISCIYRFYLPCALYGKQGSLMRCASHKIIACVLLIVLCREYAEMSSVRYVDFKPMSKKQKLKEESLRAAAELTA